eukprot:CAMPEP_0117668394 /NCGR_PEP_ID=MMETSP0804-20121206/11524_1 /TAXON_ID=1074897 /ORGANISM="Tetraselmis astigmatica, Strain CCMP880" /LENGTH=308 /DNA_ID=CAMNT_0005476279 /DNA_START=129 /DNA_END=1052 /DNA_ORIENTATION=+
MAALVCSPSDPGHSPTPISCPAALLSDRYELGAALGQGGFSHVLRVTEKSTGEEWACKIASVAPDNKRSFSRGGSGVAVSRSDVLSEVAAMRAAGKHNHIVQLKETFEQTDKIFMIMEEMRGGDLLLGIEQRGAYSEKDSREVAFRVLDALHHLHHLNISHRDVKLENMLLQRPGDLRSVKLADFGCAFVGSSKENMSNMTGVCGSPFYLSPEVVAQLDGSGGTAGTYGPECDMWAFGVALYTMLAGKPPFAGSSLPEILNSILSGTVEFNGAGWSSVSGPAVDLLRKLLNPDPKARLSAEAALQHPW